MGTMDRFVWCVQSVSIFPKRKWEWCLQRGFEGWHFLLLFRLGTRRSIWWSELFVVETTRMGFCRVIPDKWFQGINKCSSPLFFPLPITFLIFRVPNLRSFNRWQMGFWHKVAWRLQQKGDSVFCVSFGSLYSSFQFLSHHFCHHFALVIQ